MRRAVLIGWVGWLFAAAASAQPYTFPAYRDAGQVDAACKVLLADAKRQARALRQLAPEAGAGTVLADFDAMVVRYEDTLGPLGVLASTHPAKAVRDAADACELRYQAFRSGLLQSAGLYAVLRQLRPADDIDARLQRDTLELFEDAGVVLAPPAQSRAQAIDTRITRVAQDFDRRIRDDRSVVAFTAAQLKGVPPEVWHQARRDGQRRFLLGLDSPTSLPVVEQAIDPKSRERMWRARSRLGGQPNLDTLAQLVKLRREYARLFGFESYDAFVLRRRMAKDEATVLAFLGDVKQAVRGREATELATLREAKAADLKQPLASTRLHAWDVGYYTAKVRQQRYAIDQERFREYFPPEASLEVMFRLAEQLFGVRFEPARQPLWHADARAFDVKDAGTSQHQGTLFVDLYPRAGKYNHAAVWPFRNASTLRHRAPAAALVVNVDRKGLALDELETLLHEFGHAVHALLSSTRYATQGGTNVVADFGEAPSQMLESWVYDPKVLALFQQVCSGCKPVPPGPIEQADKARQFGRGILYAGQHLFAAYDLALHGKDAPDPMALWARMQGDTPLGFEPGSMVPAGFSHIASGYAAGYYGYLWSEVLAADLRTAFDADRLDPVVGRRYRDTVLANGGQVAPEQLVERFLGRPGDSRAFFKFLDPQ